MYSNKTKNSYRYYNIRYSYHKYLHRSGITTVRTLQRPVTWKKQIQDVVVNNIGIGKDRVELEPGIRPTAYLIKNVSAGSTEIFVDTAVPLFNQVDDIVETKQSILILDRTTKTGVAATAIVSGTGGISTVSISDGGSGYTVAPHVSIGITAVLEQFVWNRNHNNKRNCGCN